MADLNKLRFSRGLLKSKITRLHTYLTGIDLNNLNNTIISQLSLRLQNFESVLDEFNNIQSEIEFAIENEEPDERKEFESSYYDLISNIQTIISKFNSNSDNSIRTKMSDNQPPQQIRLPSINLPSFNGRYDQWLEFRDGFNSLIHNNKSITEIQKFYYLRSCLQEEAVQIIHSIEVSACNYTIAWELLQERFENKRLIVYNHVKSIFNFPNLIRESHVELRNLYDTIARNLRALSSLGEPTDSWDTLIIYLIVNKLDSTTRRDWESYNVENQLPTMKDINKFLKNKCEILEKLEYNKCDNPKQNKGQFKSKYHSNSCVNTSNLSCYYCKKAHTIYNCTAFLDLSINSRIEEVKKHKLCINCFKPSHIAQTCTSSNCRKCGRRHNSLLHFERPVSTILTVDTESGANLPLPAIPDMASTSQAAIVGHSTDNDVLPSQILLSTALLYVEDKHGHVHKCRALLDSGSQSNFATNDFCKRLGLQTKEINFTISGVGQAMTNIKETAFIKIQSCNNHFNKTILFLVLPKITEYLPAVSFSYKHLQIPSHLKLADPSFNKSAPIDMLLGSHVFWEIICVGQVQLGKGLPIMHKTLLGWVIAGNLNFKQMQSNTSISFLNIQHNNLQLDEQLTKFWQLEEVNCESPLSINDKYCESHFLENTRRDENGRFIVSIPLKTNIHNLGNSRQAALNRFFSLEKRLVKNNNLRNEYVKFMIEYEALGHMTLIDDSYDNDKTVYYLPHHAVIREHSSTTKVRVVFDASMKTDSGLSLNDVQCSGPTIQSDLMALILRFRVHKYVMTADICKMYRQVLINSDQRCLQRIFWRLNPTSEMKCYELNTITYGTASAPFLAVRCLYQLAEDNKITYPKASNIIKNDFYIDDLLTGANSQSELVQLQHEISTILNSAKLELRKWLSNKPELMKQFHFNQDLDVNIVQLGENEQNKTLGIFWNANLDTIQYSITQCKTQGNVTKRNILSIVSQIFDPLGLLGPVIVVAKILMQHLWQANVTWDEAIPQNIHTQWCQFLIQLQVLNKIKIPRHILILDYNIIELHGFADASTKAYGASIYIACKNKIGQFSSKLLCAKSRVAPIKQITLPRLELCGAVLLVHLVEKVKSTMDINFHKFCYYSDSTITLCWIRDSPSRWKTFVANRVSEIQQFTNIEDWYHVKSEDNPADLISRGTDSETLLNSDLWWTGPSHLIKENVNLSSNQFSITEILPEQRTVVNSMTISDNFNIFEKFSSLLKLQKVTAYCCRFIYNLKITRDQRKIGTLSPIELQDSMNLLIKICQKQAFGEDYNNLINDKSLNKRSKLLCLNPFVDNKILRVGGRIRNSNFEYDKKFLVILPHKHNLTKLIMTHEHNRLLHCGPSMLLSSTRERYWPLSGRNLARGIVRRCVTCFKSKPNSIQYLMGDLPASRVNQYIPFFNTAVDFAGPFLLKDRKTRGAKLTKAYVCLFICLATKAIHLELVSDLTTDCFLATLKRFIARRGKPTTILSDNGSNFVGASARLHELDEFFNEHKNNITNILLNDNITWKFIPSRSPNFGGIYEAGIKSTKFHLRRVMGNAHLHFEEFCTALTQIEAILNSRPLCPLTSNCDDPVPLTPAHFLIGKTLTSIPEQDVTMIQENCLSRYQRLQQIIQHFWCRWNKEYISELQTRVKWKQKSQNLLKVGSLVIVKQDNMPPLKWNVGRVVQLYPGADGIIRVASVRLNDSVVKRAVTKLCILPIPDNYHVSSENL